MRWFNHIFNKMPKKLLTKNWQNLFSERFELIDGKQRWLYSYNIFQEIYSLFSFDLLTDTANNLLNRNKLNECLQKTISKQIDIARNEYYQSLNETAEIAYILWSKELLSIQDCITVIQHFLEVGYCNFPKSSKEMIMWENKIEQIWINLNKPISSHYNKRLI